MKIRIEINAEPDHRFAHGETFRFTGEAVVSSIKSEIIDVGHGALLPGEATAEAYATVIEITSR